MLRIKRNDTVIILTGRDKGKQGTVIDLDQKNSRVKVAGIAMQTKHYKARRQGETSTMKRQEGFISLSNVMLVSPTDSKPCRVSFKVLEDGKKVRVSARTKQVM